MREVGVSWAKLARDQLASAGPQTAHPDQRECVEKVARGGERMQRRHRQAARMCNTTR